MEQSNSGEIDLRYLINELRKVLKKGIVLFFRALNYALRNWKVIAVLIVAGLVYGYYKYSKAKSLPAQSTEVLLRVNFGTVDYVYGEIEILNKKLFGKDSLFLEKVGVNFDELEILQLELIPITNIRDVIINYGPDGKNLEGILKSIEMNEDVSEMFASEYMYHKLNIVLTEQGSRESVINIIKHLNGNSFLNEVRDSKLEILNERIRGNFEIVEQIDQAIATYMAKESLTSPSDQIYIVDREFQIDEIIQKKINLYREIELFKDELVYSKAVVVIVNGPILIRTEPGILNKTYITYPILLVAGFLFLAWGWHVFFYFKEMADKNQ